ncbi:hypothetical protein [uncultured Corynebacterium sp.]|uniref:hypothetical protein n=1 Tax=uncultured Corynebacterium sp. TaxID=159447 RepID=UPI0025EA6D05|nr:hypothetical protein [uncultured Corynebacterium sp.]
MTSPDDRETPSSTPLIFAIIAVVVALMLVVGVAIGLYLGSGDDDPEPPGAQPPAPATSESDSSSDDSSSSSSSTSSTGPSTSSSPRTAEPHDDLGTGRDDVDSQGWSNFRARCSDDDLAIAVIATETGTRASACRASDGRKYYRGDAGDIGSLEAPIIVDEGDRIVAQNGAWKYQMSPDGLLITENNVVRAEQAATVWGQR